jgi:NADH-quinone oxidoreductase subunit K
MITININFLAFVTCIIFFIGLLLLILNKKNILITLIALEILLLAVSSNFEAFLRSNIEILVFFVNEAIALFASKIAFTLEIIVFSVTELMDSYALMIEFILLFAFLFHLYYFLLC